MPANLIFTIQNCEATCEQMITYVTNLPDIQRRTIQLTFLRDCADICGLTAKFIARCSPFAKAIANLCSCICETCANECFKFPDCHSQNCAQICCNCAQECRAFAMMR